ncbi:hypothetical protein YC2023_098744 [Brassica napus]
MKGSRIQFVRLGLELRRVGFGDYDEYDEDHLSVIDASLRSSVELFASDETETASRESWSRLLVELEAPAEESEDVTVGIAI